MSWTKETHGMLGYFESSKIDLVGITLDLAQTLSRLNDSIDGTYMKKKKTILLLLLPIVLMNCDSHDQESKEIELKTGIHDSSLYKLIDSIPSNSQLLGEELPIFEESISYLVKEELLEFICEDLSLATHLYLNKKNTPGYQYEEEVYQELSESPDTVVKISKGGSFMKMYRNEVKGSFDVVSGIIRSNNDLIFPKNIRIGINREVLLRGIFQGSIPDSVKNVRIIRCGEIAEGNYYEFRFKNDTLNEIIIDSDYDWINKEID